MLRFASALLVAAAVVAAPAGSRTAATPPKVTADLFVTGSSSPVRIFVGDTVTWRFQVGNRTNVVASYVLLELQFTPAIGLPVMQSDRGQPCSADLNTTRVVCILDYLPGTDTTANVVVVAKVKQAGTQVAQASVRHYGTDPNPADNTLSLTSTVYGPRPAFTPPGASPAGVSRRGTARGDVLRGTPRADVLAGLAGNDRLYGLGADDVLRGGAGADDVAGGAGKDVVLGGLGNDTLRTADGEADQIACGPGRDEVVADRRDRIAEDCEQVIWH